MVWVRDGLGRTSRVVRDDYRVKGIELLMSLRSGAYEHERLNASKRDEL